MQIDPTGPVWCAADLRQAATATLDSALLHHTPIALYGAGQTGRLVAHCLKDAATLFIDDTPEKGGSIVDGLRVTNATAAHDEYGNNLLVVVCIFSPAHRFVTTKQRLESQFGWKVCSFAEVLLKTETALPCYYLDSIARQASLQVGYARILAHLADQRSREVLLENLRMRLLADFSGTVDARTEMDFLRLPAHAQVSYVDCGAYDGDTVQDFLDWRGDRFERIVAFEPDPDNFIKLRNRISRLADTLSARVELRQEAVWSDRGEISFSAAGSVASAISAAGQVSARAARLDDWSDLPGILLLKLDVEGAEREALSGGLELIRDRRPILAISVYHQPDDLIALFDRMDALNLGYRFFLRCHGGDGTDLVLYCVPDPLPPPG